MAIVKVYNKKYSNKCTSFHELKFEHQLTRCTMWMYIRVCVCVRKCICPYDDNHWVHLNCRLFQIQWYIFLFASEYILVRHRKRKRNARKEKTNQDCARGWQLFKRKYRTSTTNYDTNDVHIWNKKLNWKCLSPFICVRHHRKRPNWWSPSKCPITYNIFQTRTTKTLINRLRYEQNSSEIL